MLEMPHAGDNHGQVILLAIFDTIVIADRSTWLNKSGYTCLVAQLHAVIKWEKCIRRHYCSGKIEFELVCFFNCLPKRIDPAGLTATFPDEFFTFHESNRI